MATTTTSRLLLDTHTFIWWRAAQSRVGTEALHAIAEAETVYVSMASAWEAAIKISIGKLRLHLPGSRRASPRAGFVRCKSRSGTLTVWRRSRSFTAIPLTAY